MMPRQVGKLDKSTIFLLAFAAIPVAWLALLAAPLLGAEQTLPGLLEGLNAALAQPWRIQWCEQSPKCLLLALGAVWRGRAGLDNIPARAISEYPGAGQSP